MLHHLLDIERHTVDEVFSKSMKNTKLITIHRIDKNAVGLSSHREFHPAGLIRFMFLSLRSTTCTIEKSFGTSTEE